MNSKYFDESDFCCKGEDQGTCECGHDCYINPRLIELLDLLVDNMGGIVPEINSGYRCPEHNAAVGGVWNSQHTQGNAADLAVPDCMDIDTFEWYVKQLPFDGVGYYEDDNFIHVDVRDGGTGLEYYWEG